jgi:hypothetical protein
MKPDSPLHEDEALSLESIQDLFWELIAAPEGVRPGMEALRRQGRFPHSDLSAMVRGDERLAAEDRLDIYASMYFYRLRDCLAEDFPKVAAVVGGAEFHNLATDFLLVHPSRHWSLRYLGDPFAAFLADHRLGKKYGFLSDLARLEWARIEAFDALDAEVLTSDMATAAGPELSLRLVPAARILTVGWNVAPLWRHLEDEGVEGLHGSHSAAVVPDDQEVFAEPMAVEIPEQRPCALLVWRHEFRVFHRSLGMAEANCLQALGGEAINLPALCEQLVGQQEKAGDGEQDPQNAIREIATLLGRWLADGILRG